jgi:tetratricopeptide (TPR) repeat protein
MQVDAKRAERAERAKTRGNEAFKAGRFMDAIKAYSEALKLHPNNPIYANNRAMAYLKVFRWAYLYLCWAAGCRGDAVFRGCSSCVKQCDCGLREGMGVCYMFDRMFV